MRHRCPVDCLTSSVQRGRLCHDALSRISMCSNANQEERIYSREFGASPCAKSCIMGGSNVGYLGAGRGRVPPVRRRVEGRRVMPSGSGDRQAWWKDETQSDRNRSGYEGRPKSARKRGKSRNDNVGSTKVIRDCRGCVALPRNRTKQYTMVIQDILFIQSIHFPVTHRAIYTQSVLSKKTTLYSISTCNKS